MFQGQRLMAMIHDVRPRRPGRGAGAPVRRARGPLDRVGRRRRGHHLAWGDTVIWTANDSNESNTSM